MKTTEQQILLMHRRAEKMVQRQKRYILSLSAGLSVVLFGALFGVISGFSGLFHGISGESFAGASILDETIGGYLLAAVLAFMAGAAITVICLKRQNRTPGKAGRGITQGKEEKTNTDLDPKEKGDL